MNFTIYAIIIGVIYCILYLVTSGTLIYALVYLVHTNDSENTNGTEIIIASITLVFSLVMFLISVLLIEGARKRRASLIAPWLFLTIVGISCNIVALIFQGYTLTFSDILWRVMYMGLKSLICYPIYRLWKELHFGDYAPLLDHPGQPSGSPPQRQQQQPPSANNATDAGSNGY